MPSAGHWVTTRKTKAPRLRWTATAALWVIGKQVTKGKKIEERSTFQRGMIRYLICGDGPR